MESLKTLQVLAKIGKIISKIVYIVMSISAVICAISLIITVVFGNVESFQIGNTTIHGLVEGITDLTKAQAIAAMGCGFVVCLMHQVVAKMANNYFKKELADGTPFTFDGAKDMLKLGIVATVLPILQIVACGIVDTIVSFATSTIFDFNIDSECNITMGVMFIIMSVVFKAGAEAIENKRLTE